MAVSVTANAASTPLGGTGSAAQAGATGSSGGTTTGTVACSSCCAPQGRYLVTLFGGYGYAGNCPGAIDNSQPFDVYLTAVLSFNSPYTAAQFCLPSSFTMTARSADYINANFDVLATCPTISPPATQSTLGYKTRGFLVSIDSSTGLDTIYNFGANMCSCNFANSIFLGSTNNIFSSLLTVVSCTPPVYSFPAIIFDSSFFNIGTAAITVTF